MKRLWESVLLAIGMATVIGSVVLVGALRAQAQVQQPGVAPTMLSGKFGGHAEGFDVDGHWVGHVAEFTFTNGFLTGFSEIVLFGAHEPGSPTIACRFDPLISASSYPYLSYGSTPDPGKYVGMVSFGCPNGSGNQRAESLNILPVAGGSRFRYTMFAGRGLWNNPRATLTGEAIKE